MAKSFKTLKADLSPERLANIEKRVESILLSMALQELRESRQLTQQALAERLGITQVALSKMENQEDIKISTLKKLFAAMGGKLKIIVEFPDSDILLNQFVSP